MKFAARYCEARTWQQARSAGWGNSNVGCQRAALFLTPDGHWACKHHYDRPPANGWNH